MDDEYINICNDEFINIYKINAKDKIKLDNNFNIDCGNFTAYFNFEEYLSDIILSYDKNSHNVIEQFKKDYYRHIIKLNDHIYNNVESFITHITNLNINNIKALIIILCCQSSLALPFEIINKLYNENNINKLIKQNSNKKIIIDIKITNTLQSINIYANFEKITLEPFIKTHNINTILSFDMSNTNIDHDLTNLSNYICLFNWTIANR